MKTIKFLVAILISIALAACGGGSSGSPAALTASKVITGTAAAGAPVIGYVSVRDNSANPQPVKTNIAIQANGNYSVDVTGLTPPFAFLATGTVGGKTVSLYSAATVADVGGTIDITPFTDLIIRNVAATAVDTYLNSGGLAGLTAAQLDAKRVALTTQLTPALTAMGLSASIDLLRATFNADSTGLDRFMDVVKVSTTGTTATITNILDAASTLVIDTSTGAPTGTLGTIGLAPAATPVDGINATMNAFSAFFATSLPSATNQNLVALFASTFLDNGKGAKGFLTDVTTTKNIVGLKFANVSVDSVSAASGVAQVSFVPMSATGVNLSNNNNAEHWQMVKDTTTGTWLLNGNQMIAGVRISTNAAKQTCYPASTSCMMQPTTQYRTGLNLWIDNQGAQAIGSATVTGPGLPSGGVNLVAQTNLTWFAITTTDTVNPPCIGCTGGNNIWNLSDASINAVTANSTYTVQIYSNATPPILVGTYSFVVPVPPVLNTQLATLAFPSISTSGTSGMINPSGQGAVTFPLSWAVPTGLVADTLNVTAWQSGTSNTANINIDLSMNPATTGTSTIVLTAPTTGLWTSGSYWINGRDQNGGMVNTNYQ